MIDDNRSRRNVIRDTIADFQEKLRQQYVEQNTAKMNISQLKAKAEEIRKGYEQINRDQAEIKRQVQEIRRDHEMITRELESSKTDEQELETFIETRQKELDEWRNEEGRITKSLEEIRLEAAGLEQKEKFGQENLSRLISEMKTFDEEKRLGDLLEAASDMENKKKAIDEIKSDIEAFGTQEQDVQADGKLAKGEKDEKNSRHKVFFKRDSLSEQKGLLDKECFRLSSLMEKAEEDREAQ